MQGPRTGFQQDLHNVCFIYHGPLSLRHETLARSSQKDPARELIIFFHPGFRESAKISTAPQRERSDTHKSTEKVARGSDIKSRAALRWERSDAHKVPRGLHERYQNSHRTALRAIQGCAEQKRDNRFVRACAGEMHMDISQGHSYASLYSEKTRARMERPDLTPAFYLHRKNPLVCSPWIPGGFNFSAPRFPRRRVLARSRLSQRYAHARLMKADFWGKNVIQKWAGADPRLVVDYSDLMGA